jgi:hypothetical protein
MPSKGSIWQRNGLAAGHEAIASLDQTIEYLGSQGLSHCTASSKKTTGEVIAMDKVQQTLERWCTAAGVNFVDGRAEENYKKRARRIADVIQLKVPDRVPVAPSFGMFPALDNGFTCEEVMFDYDKAHQAWMKTLKDFEPDMFRASSYAFPGPVFEALKYKLLKLPGRGIPANHVFQFVEEEYVKAEEFYDAFINDPTDFMMRVYLPRVCGALEPLRCWPPFPPGLDTISDWYPM